MNQLIVEPKDSDPHRWDHQDLLTRLGQDGALLLRNFNWDVEEFCQLCERFPQKFMSYRAGAYQREKFAGKSNLLTVNQGKMPISLHGEMHYKRRKPDFIWFYCETAPIRGGETLVADGKKIFKGLSKSTQQLLRQKPIIYWRSFSPAFWPKVFGTQRQWLVRGFCRIEGMKAHFDSDGYLTTQYQSYAVSKQPDGDFSFINNLLVIVHDSPKLPKAYLDMCTSRVAFGDGTELPEGLIQEIQGVCGEVTFPIEWSRGDVCVIDNRRTMHGRNSIAADCPRKILTRLGSHSRPLLSTRLSKLSISSSPKGVSGSFS